MSPPDVLARLLADGRSRSGPVVFLTGAGVSAASGIPTFRGPEGYWTIGSREYRPESLATFDAFTAMPAEVWGWYLYRRAVCRAATPNPAHAALVEAERRRADRFLLVTQNVDGLHLRAGNSRGRTYQVHGNIDFLRCLDACSVGLHPVPEGFETWEKSRLPTASEIDRLRCPDCGGPGRPHVLWFDESYDEPLFRFESTLRAATSCALLVVAGTAGATNLPSQLVATVARRGVPFVVVDPSDNAFTSLAERVPSGLFLRGTAVEWLPKVVASLG